MAMHTLRIITCFVMLVASCVAHVRETTQTEPINVEDSAERESVQTDPNELLFKKLFARRRGEHLQAVNGLRKMENYERQYKMISVFAETVFLVIQTSRGILESAGFEPGNTSFPKNVYVRDALSNVLENTALFGDIILHLPDISHRVLNAQQQWDTMLQWSLSFVNRTQHLLDQSTKTLIHLVCQELNITTREPGYFNPYRSNAIGGSNDGEETAKKEKKRPKKEKKKKKPRMTIIEL